MGYLATASQMRRMDQVAIQERGVHSVQLMERAAQGVARAAGRLVAGERLPEERIDEVLDIVDLKNTGKKRAAKFSMGMKQRLGIAIALLNHPSLVILDEPTNGLDPFGVKELRELIASFPSRGITVVLSSHILSEVERMCDRIGIIRAGEIVETGTLEEMRQLTRT